MSTRKERERAEAAEAKAAEKAAKKAELAAKRAARDAEKAAKKAEEEEKKEEAGADPEEEEAEEEEEDPNAWQEEEELALLEGLRRYPKGQGDFANEGERYPQGHSGGHRHGKGSRQMTEANDQQALQ